MAEDEMVGWHHQLDVHELEQVPGAGDGHGTWRAAVFGAQYLSFFYSPALTLIHCYWKINNFD